MTKKLLLAAASVGALAFAGAASAADLTVSLASAQVTPGAPYVIGDVAEGTLVGVLEAEATYDNVIPLANNLLVTLRLANGATFASAVGIGNIDLLDGAGVTITNQQKTVSDGGAVGSNFVTYLVSTPSDAIKSVQFGDFGAGDVEISFAAKAKPTVAIETKTEFGTNIEGGNAKFGSATAATLVDYAGLVTVAIDDNPAGDAILSLATDPIFSQFDVGGAATSATAAELGTISVKLNDVYLPVATTTPGVYDLTAAKVTSAAVDDLEIEYEGRFGGTTGVALTPLGVVVKNGSLLTEVYNGTVVANLASTDSKLASDYRARVTVNYADYDPYVSPYFDLSSIKRDGVAAEVPWVASNALAALNMSRSIIRVANKSDQPANVYVEYVTSAAAQGLTPAPTVAAGEPVLVDTVSAKSDLQISNAKLTSLLGEFVRGNVIVTVEAKKDEITVNNRISYADGKVEETTIIPR